MHQKLSFTIYGHYYIIMFIYGKQEFLVHIVCNIYIYINTPPQLTQVFWTRGVATAKFLIPVSHSMFNLSFEFDF